MHMYEKLPDYVDPINVYVENCHTCMKNAKKILPVHVDPTYGTCIESLLMTFFADL